MVIKKKKNSEKRILWVCISCSRGGVVGYNKNSRNNYSIGYKIIEQHGELSPDCPMKSFGEILEKFVVGDEDESQFFSPNAIRTGYDPGPDMGEDYTYYAMYGPRSY